VRRLSVASPDSGAESPVYGEDSSAMELGVPPYASNGALVISAEPVWPPVASVAALTAAQRTGSGVSAKSEPVGQLFGFFEASAGGGQAALSRCLASAAAASGLGGAVGFGGIASLQVPRGGSTRDITVTLNCSPGQGSAGARRLATSSDMSVVDQQSGKWYVEDIRASTQPMGVQ
jgi:hypothetical protein